MGTDSRVKRLDVADADLHLDEMLHRLAGAILFVLMGCSTVATLEDGDAGAAQPEPDGAAAPGPDADAAAVTPVCPGQPPAETSLALPERCDGGYLYAVYSINGSLCPMGDTGSCVALRNDLNAHYAEVCCEQAACVRATAPLDENCAAEFDAGDGGKYTGWSCAAKALPRGKCVPRGGREYCCQP